jgi:hypothetical protein
VKVIAYYKVIHPLKMPTESIIVLIDSKLARPHTAYQASEIQDHNSQSNEQLDQVSGVKYHQGLIKHWILTSIGITYPAYSVTEPHPQLKFSISDFSPTPTVKMCRWVRECWKCNIEGCKKWGILHQYPKPCKLVLEGRTLHCASRGRPDPEYPGVLQEEWDHDFHCRECTEKIEDERRAQKQSG